VSLGRTAIALPKAGRMIFLDNIKESPARSARSGGVTFFNDYKAQFIDLFEQVQSWIN
jgi:hypothetical protein